MKAQLTAEGELIVGQPIALEGRSPAHNLAAVFEDDGQTGYFYALHYDRPGNPIVDALHIYNAVDVSDGSQPSKVQISWSLDSMKVVLLINDHPHGIFDFVAHRGYCRTGAPGSVGDWSVEGHAWDDEALELFA